MDQVSETTRRLTLKGTRRALESLALPAAETLYLEKVVDSLQSQLAQRLVGVYLFGSAGYGDYRPGISDLDVQAVVTKPLEAQESRAIAMALSHARLPCPAKRLELVCYAQAAVKPARRWPQFELNFNTGCDMEDHLSLDPNEEASHWFLLDIAIGRELGRSLVGPAPEQVFAPIPRLWQLEGIADSLVWHTEHELTLANSVLNACRGWRYALTGAWGSKRTGVEWALTQPECPAVVVQAETQRVGGSALDPSEATELITLVTQAVQTAIAQERAADLA
jgi:hypothetical protein